MARLAPLVLFGPAATWLVLATGASVRTAADPQAWGPLARRFGDGVGDAACRRCHPDEHASWHASYHRTMTQRIDDPAAIVLAPFAGETLVALGFVATMDRDDEGRPRVRIVDPDGAAVIDAPIELAVGSHRAQQYVARIDRGGGPGELWRLPVAWHVGSERWIHLNGAFLSPDGREGDRDDYLRHFSRYNDNCLLCHNTEPVPGRGADGRFDSHVTQWGIGCEACHGPGAEHVARMDAPIRRVLSAAGADGTMTDPRRMPADRSSEICGRCHGQRIAADIADVLAHGDGFVPGAALSERSRPITRDAAIAGAPELDFSGRFWPDGTPRLSAYEYQGLLGSACFADGRGLGCGDCHSMHGDEPAMQLRADFDPVASCVRCHERGALSGGAAHGGHDERVACIDCHMPQTTYGLLEGMISHRIGSPDPAAWVGRHDAPDACTQCHVDRSRAWAAAAMGGLGFSAAPAAVEDPSEAWASRVVLDLHGGDPIQRALAAHALAWPRASGDRDARMAALAAGVLDEYPAVRRFALRGLGQLARAGGRDDVLALVEARVPEDPIAVRLELWQALVAALGPGPIAGQPARVSALEDRRDQTEIWIGE